MILAIDIGNSSISCGVFSMPVSGDIAKNEPPVLVCRFKIAARALSADEYLLLFRQFLSMHQIKMYVSNDSAVSNTDFLDACVIASVVPALTEIIASAAEEIIGSKPFMINPGIRTGFALRIQNPEQLGADIVANTAGALQIGVKPPFVVLDVGTATTITFVNAQKELLGTIIMPGLAVSMSALTDSAALLMGVPLEKPDELLGKNTSDAIRSGVIGGHALMIDGFLRNIRETYPEKNENGEPWKLSLVATGGLALSILPFCRNKFLFAQDLTLSGAVSLWQKNYTLRK